MTSESMSGCRSQMSALSVLPSKNLEKLHIMCRHFSPVSGCCVTEKSIQSLLLSKCVVPWSDDCGSDSLPSGITFRIVSVCSQGISLQSFPESSLRSSQYSSSQSAPNSFLRSSSSSSDADCSPIYPSSEIVKAPANPSPITR